MLTKIAVNLKASCYADDHLWIL